MITSPFQVAHRFIGVKELEGSANNPLIIAMIDTCQEGIIDDEVPWCSAFVNFIHKFLGLPRTHSLRAKSWLEIGVSISLPYAMPDSDILILHRTDNPALGHVGYFAGVHEDKVLVLGGNQNNSVSIQSFPISKIAGIRRII